MGIIFLSTESYVWDADPPDPPQEPQDEHEYDVFYYINKLGVYVWELVGTKSKKYLMLIF